MSEINDNEWLPTWDPLPRLHRDLAPQRRNEVIKDVQERIGCFLWSFLGFHRELLGSRSFEHRELYPRSLFGCDARDGRWHHEDFWTLREVGQMIES